MKSRGSRRAAVAFVFFVVGPGLGCAAARRPPVEAPRDEASRAAPPSREDRPVPAVVAPPVSVASTACEPRGKAVVVVARDAAGRPSRWRYFAPARHGQRGALTCEAADSNGDGKVDARYFYGRGGRLVREQRDLDFDGRDELVADYSHFPVPRGGVD
jgi:hypothetical protein